MKSPLRLIPLLFVVLFCTTCGRSNEASITILDGGRTISFSSTERLPSRLLTQAKLTLGQNDRLLYLGSSTPLDAALPDAPNLFLEVRRAVTLTLVKPDGTQTLETSALTVGQALSEAGLTLYAADRLDPPAGTPIDGPLTVTYVPARLLTVSVNGSTVEIRSAAGTVGQALAEAGIPLEGLDTSQPLESAPLPADGKIRVVHVVESVVLTQKSIPFNTRTELAADLELDQQALLQGGQPGLAVTRTRVRSEDGVEVSRQTEGETVVRPAEDRVLGYGTKLVPRTITVDGQRITYWRALRLYATSYSPCRSAGVPGKCYTGTSSGLPVKRGVVAMVYSWYLLFGEQSLYIPGYGYATVGDVGGGYPKGNHYWIDLGWTDEEYQPMEGWMTVYFLLPAQANPGYILP
jgi:resuscitation-promoting factor RpfB